MSAGRYGEGEIRSQGRAISIGEELKADEQNHSGRDSGRRILSPDEPESSEPPESISGGPISRRPDDNQRFALEPLPIKGLKPFLYAAAALLVVYTGFSLYETTVSLWQKHWIIGTSFLALVTTVLVLGVTAARSYLVGVDTARELDSIRDLSSRIRPSRDRGQGELLINELESFYSGKPQQELLKVAIAQLEDYFDDREILDSLERNFFQVLDQAATAKISSHCLYTGTTIALSPWAVMDVGLALWRNVRMVEEVASIYGFRPGYAQRIRLLRMVLTNMAFVGGSQVLMDSLAESATRLGVGLPIFSSFAQGVGAAIYTGRIGITAIECSRPVENPQDSRPTLSKLLSPTISDLQARMASFVSGSGEAE